MKLRFHISSLTIFINIWSSAASFLLLQNNSVSLDDHELNEGSFKEDYTRVFRQTRSITRGHTIYDTIGVTYNEIKTSLDSKLSNRLSVIENSNFRNENQLKEVLLNEHYKSAGKKGIENFSMDGDIREIMKSFHNTGDCLMAALSNTRLAAADSRPVWRLATNYHTFLVDSLITVDKFRKNAFSVLQGRDEIKNKNCYLVSRHYTIQTISIQCSQLFISFPLFKLPQKFFQISKER